MLRLPFTGKSSASTQNDTTLISAGTLIEGDITFTGTLEVEGRVIGEIRAGADPHAVVRILPRGQVLGSIRSPIVVVNGEVSGNVQSSEHVELAAAAVVHGDVQYSLIEMTRGAQVNGRLVYRASPPVEPEAGRCDSEGLVVAPLDE
jgi:cytoskeletal protein CcmA (bactofilin family)